MNVYDFDKTIYGGDSTVDFYFYCIKKHPRVLKYLPGLLFFAAVFLLGIYDKTKFKEKFYRFLQEVKPVSATLEDFWDKHEYKIKEYYKNQHQEEDVVISASPEFLLTPICRRLGIRHLIASRVDPATGRYTGENCYGEEKVIRLNIFFQSYSIDEFYSDSLSDTPLAMLAKRSYYVKGNNRIPWEEYKPTVFEKIKKIFLARDFMLFLIIGVVNTINGVLFAFLYSFFLDANVSFALGYLSSLTIAYLLNSVVTFRERLSWGRYGKFCVSYVPNFLIQNIVVIVCYNLLGWHKIIAFALAAAIGVPVTFILMKFFAFKKK